MSRGWKLALVALPYGCFTALSWGQIPSFPGAEGFGATTPGGRGGDVYHVTSLADTNTVGTLRHAISSAPTTGRTIVFDVSGDIYLTSSLNINKPKITIAGQTAPGKGVTISGRPITLSNNDQIVRYIRGRLTSTGGTGDALSVNNGNRIVIDHSSASWSEDEVASVTNNSTDVTIQWSLVTEALNYNNHSRGSLFRPGANVAAGTAPHSFNLTVHHSLYAHTSDRNPRFGTYNGKLLNADFRNNLVFDWRNQASHSGDAGEFLNLNFVGNYYVAGLTTRSDLVANPKIFSADGPDTTLYHLDNKVDATRTDGLHNGIELASSIGGGYTPRAVPFDFPAVTTESADDAYHSVLAYSGAFWWDRDVVDQRVITDVEEISDPDPAIRAQSGMMLVRETDIYASPANWAVPIESRPADWDTDHDGMPNAWELAHGLNPNVADNNGDFDSDGYTNLEDYINELGAWPAPREIEFSGATNQRYAEITNWGIPWQPSRFDVAVIRNGTVTVDSPGQHAGTLKLATSAGDNATLNITAGWLTVHDEAHGDGNGELIIGADPLASATLNLSGGILIAKTLSKSAGGQFNFTGGVLSAETVGFTLENQGGTIAPGSSPGMTHVMGDLVLDSGVLEIEIGGTDPLQYDRIAVDGETTLGGTLQVKLADLDGDGNAFVPSLDDQFAFLVTGGIDPLEVFDAVDFSLAPLPEGLEWELTTGTTTFLTVVAAEVGLDGDFNNDGVVDAGDYVRWRNHLGDPDETAIFNNGDGGDVGLGDYALWKANYGNPPTEGGGGLAGVPEPASALLLLVGAAVGWCLRRVW